MTVIAIVANQGLGLLQKCGYRFGLNIANSIVIGQGERIEMGRRAGALTFRAHGLWLENEVKEEIEKR